MHIVFVAQGSLPIPPVGWGAVEHILWQYTQILREHGHTVTIINEKWRKASLQVAWLVRTRPVDVVHTHQERALRWIAPLCAGRALVAATSHAPIDQELHLESGQAALRDLLLADYHLVLHSAVGDVIRTHKPGAKVEILRNGAEVEQFQLDPNHNGRAICLGKISKRKRQRELAIAMRGSAVGIDFVGPAGDESLEAEDQHALIGEWNREQILTKLGGYGALALVSHSEGQPLVVAEALAAGVPVVVSPNSAVNLPLDAPFVTVVSDPSEWRPAIEKAVTLGSEVRQMARQFAEQSLGFKTIVPEYVLQLERWLPDSRSAR